MLWLSSAGTYPSTWSHVDQLEKYKPFSHDLHKMKEKKAKNRLMLTNCHTEIELRLEQFLVFVSFCLLLVCIFQCKYPPLFTSTSVYNKGITWPFEGILFICARVVSFAARARSARAANDTTRAQINNIPEKSHVIIIIINKQGQMISRMRVLIIKAKWITTNSNSLQIIR